MRFKMSSLLFLVLFSLTNLCFGDISLDDKSDIDVTTEGPLELIAVTEEVIVPVKVEFNPGDRIYLPPNLVGLQNMAICNLPRTINFVNVIEAFREVVNGVRYELLINAVNTTETDNKELICRLVILEKPWLVTIWGDKLRSLQYSNCTDPKSDKVSQETINQIYKTNTIFDGSAIGDDEEGLAKIDAQIIQPKEKVVAFKETTTFAPIVVADEENDENMEGSTISDLSDDNKNLLNGFFSIFETPTQQDEVEVRDKIVLLPSDISTINNEIIDKNYDLETREKRQVVGGNSALPKEEAKALLSRTFANIALGDDGADIRIKSIHSAEQQVVSGILYKIKGDFFINGNEKSNCKVNIWERSWLDDSEKLQTEVSCPGDGIKQFKHNVARRSIGTPKGAPKEISIEEGLNLAKKVFASIDTGEEATEITEVLSATKQTVAGINYNLKVNIIQNGKAKSNCKMIIYTRPWEQEDNTETTLNCPGEEKITRKHKISKRSVSVGGAEEFSHAEARNDLEDAFSSFAAGDQPSYKVSKINSAYTQLVSGKLRKINADLLTPENQIITCDIKMHDQPWVHHNGLHITITCPNQEEVKFTITAKRYRFNVEENFPHHRHVAEKKDQKKTIHQVLDKVEHQFNKFQIEHGKVYHTTTEKQMRLTIFKRNLQLIDDLNRFEQGTAKYGVTEFADLTHDEFRYRTGLVRNLGEGNKISNPVAEIPNIALPKQFDWREKNVISPVKNQGQCGSCWAFSVVGNIEGLHAIKTNQLEEYSEQELVDCDTVDAACNGGDMDKAYQQIEKIGGLELESEYPYKARKQQCKFDESRVNVKVKGAVDLPKNETSMAQWLVANGPISIGLNANAMQFYRGGISHPWKILCRSSGLDHGVLIVGFGVAEYPLLNKTLPYWIVKNSWGPKWGEQGYYRIYRGENACGVKEMATSAVLED